MRHSQAHRRQSIIELVGHGRAADKRSPKFIGEALYPIPLRTCRPSVTHDRKTLTPSKINITLILFYYRIKPQVSLNFVPTLREPNQTTNVFRGRSLNNPVILIIYVDFASVEILRPVIAPPPHLRWSDHCVDLSWPNCTVRKIPETTYQSLLPVKHFENFSH